MIETDEATILFAEFKAFTGNAEKQGAIVFLGAIIELVVPCLHRRTGQPLQTVESPRGHLSSSVHVSDLLLRLQNATDSRFSERDNGSPRWDNSPQHGIRQVDRRTVANPR